MLYMILMLRRPISPLFPYTTLFRSDPGAEGVRGEGAGSGRAHRGARGRACGRPAASRHRRDRAGANHRAAACPARRVRSEEHTSELQSRVDLVCRLLLEKKKQTKHV